MWQLGGGVLSPRVVCSAEAVQSLSYRSSTLKEQRCTEHELRTVLAVTAGAAVTVVAFGCDTSP